MDREIERVIISSSAAAAGLLKQDILEYSFGMPVEIIDNLRSCPVSKQAEDSYGRLQSKELAFSSLIGLALEFPRHRIELIPQELQIERGVQEKGKDLFTMGTLLVFILVLFSGIFWARLYNKERYLTQLKNRLTEIQANTDKINNMIGVIQTLKDRIRTRGIALNLIYEIHRLMSPEIHLASLSFKGDDSLILRGTSSSMSEIFNFVNKLEDSEYFKSVNTKYATKHKAAGAELSDFEISCPLEEKYSNIEKHGL